MPDAQPPKKPGPLRWILLGCGLLAGVVLLGLGSCAGVMYFIYKGTDPVALLGADYLLRSPEIKQSLGEGLVIKRNAMGWNVNVHNDGGNARIAYTIRTSADAPIGEAVVWLLRSGGKWQPVGARVKRPSGDDVTVGKPPSEHHLKWDD